MPPMEVEFEVLPMRPHSNYCFDGVRTRMCLMGLGTVTACVVKNQLPVDDTKGLAMNRENVIKVYYNKKRRFPLLTLNQAINGRLCTAG